MSNHLLILTISKRANKVIHPFYVFQIASVILWSLDDYYYYAFCIALISILSVTTTLIETKKVRLQLYVFCLQTLNPDDLQTISRMREMSRFSCEVHILVDGECM